MKRREFIVLTGVGATSATVLSSCGHPEEKLIPAFIPDDEYVPGIDYWKAATCGMCHAGCGIIVRTREHKANKIEGNPHHPVNRGTLCARGQAGLQLLYNPDRIPVPMKRTGDRGSGQFTEIGWDEAIKSLAEKLLEIKEQGRAESLLFLSGRAGGVTALTAERLVTGLGAKRLLAMGSMTETPLPTFDIANAHYLLSFGARFLETWHSPVKYSLAYGEFRKTSGRPRGKFVQVEPRMSLTGANADEWLPAMPGTEWLVALGVAQVMIRESLIQSSAIDSIPLPPSLGGGDWADFQPEQTADKTGISADTIVRIAREFAASQPGLAIGNGSFVAGEQNHAEAIQLLNQIVGNANKAGGVFTPSDRFDPFKTWRQGHVEWASAGDDVTAGGDVSALLVHHANPVYAYPRNADKIKGIPFIASFSSFMDETTELADIILPDHTFLESWDLAALNHGNAGPTASLTQPVVKPGFNTRQTADVLIDLTRELGGEPGFESAEDAVRKAMEELAKAKGSIDAESAAEDFWTAFVERGVWVGEKAESPALGTAAGTAVAPATEVRQTEGDDRPLRLLIYEHSALGDGSFANVPLLQELPDPLTSVIWGSWVEINPKTAASQGIADGDLVEVSTTEGSLEVPAVLYPAIRPDVIAMPLGQGHSSFGRYARNRGVNPAVLIPDAGGSEAEVVVRAKVRKVSGHGNLIRFGTSLPEHLHVKR